MNDPIKSSIEIFDLDNFFNRGLQYGDGLFETMLVVDGRIPLWDFHWQRLTNSVKVLQLDLPDESLFLNHLAQWTWPAENSVLKLMLWRGNTGRGYLARNTNSDWIMQASPLSAIQKKPVHLGVAELRLAEQPVLAGLKHLNRLEQVFLARELSESKFDELLVCSQSEIVIEVVSQNLVFIRGDRLYTPDVSLCGVSGVGVTWLKSHFEVKDVKVNKDELTGYDAMFLINSVRGVTPIQSVDGIKKFSTDSQLRDRINGLWNGLMAS